MAPFRNHSSGLYLASVKKLRDLTKQSSFNLGQRIGKILQNPPFLAVPLATKDIFWTFSILRVAFSQCIHNYFISILTKNNIFEILRGIFHLKQFRKRYHKIVTYLFYSRMKNKMKKFGNLLSLFSRVSSKCLLDRLHYLRRQ